MEGALDVHLAMWVTSETLTPSEIRRVQEERERRKRLQKRSERVGLLIGPEGVTNEQLAKLAEALTGQRGSMNEIWHPGVQRNVHSLCKSFGVAVEVHPDTDRVRAWKIIVRNSTRLLAFPRSAQDPHLEDDVWAMVRYAKHRDVPVSVFIPSGERR